MSRNCLRQVCRFESWNENLSSKLAFERFVRRNRETFWVAEFHSAVIRSLKCLKMSANIAIDWERQSSTQKHFSVASRSRNSHRIGKETAQVLYRDVWLFHKVFFTFQWSAFLRMFFEIFFAWVAWVWTVEMWIFLAHHNLLSKQASFAF